MSQLLRREIPIAITFSTGMIMILDYFLEIPTLSTLSSNLRILTLIVSAFALGLGGAAMMRYHLPKVAMKVKGEWQYSLVLIASFALMLVIGLVKGTNDSTYQYLFGALYTPVSAAVYSLLGFFIISACYRTFRTRNLEATVLLVAGLIAMLKNAPVGSVAWPIFTVIGDWLMDYHTTAAIRGLRITLALGFALLGIRIILGYERGHIGGGT